MAMSSGYMQGIKRSNGVKYKIFRLMLASHAISFLIQHRIILYVALVAIVFSRRRTLRLKTLMEVFRHDVSIRLKILLGLIVYAAASTCIFLIYRVHYQDLQP